MQIFDEGPVLPSEIDSLGHMNVRFYLSRVDRANEKLLTAAGLSNQPSGCVIRRYDTYSRFRREQFDGAPLQVVGGLLAVSVDQAQCYFEIRNSAKDEIAASFITVSTLIDASTQAPMKFAESATGANEKYGVKLPRQGAPRSLSLDPPNTNITLDQLSERVGDNPAPGMMSGRRESMVEQDDCETNSRLREDVDLMFVMHKPQPGEDISTFGPPVMKTDDGRRFSWAMIETRAVTLARPHAGDRLISIGADIGLGDRWRQSRRWAFIAETGALIGVNDTVGIALDLDARRSIDIPSSVRATIERDYLPDLA